MTLLETLKQSRAMWLWLYENPGKSKVDYLYYKNIHPPSSIKHFCFICHHHIKGEYCQGDCPIIWAEEYPNEPYICEYPESPYWQWLDSLSGSEEEHEAAGKIIDLHDEAIERCKDV